MKLCLHNSFSVGSLRSRDILPSIGLIWHSLDGMHTKNRDPRKGELRMKQILGALSNHIRHLWSSRNACLHDNDSPSVSISAETIEITYYHSWPHLLCLGDQHYCNRSLSKILSSSPATRRRWLRKVKQSSAQLTKDGTRQSLFTSFFRPVQP